MVVREIKGREILDSRGNPTVEVTLETKEGLFTDSAPSGASKGDYEAVELRDGGKRYFGLGVQKAVYNVNEIIAPKIKGKKIRSLAEGDKILLELDGTPHKSHLGSNAILPISLSFARALAKENNLPLYKYIRFLSPFASESFFLPKASFNILNGGLHAGNDLDIQEFMIVPQETSFRENLRLASEIYHQLKKNLSRDFGKSATNLGDEGGFAPPLKFPQKALEIIWESVKELGYEKKVKFILDAASSQFFKNGHYLMKIGSFSGEELLDYYSNLVSRYPIIGLEDPFAEDDFSNWEKIRKKMPSLLVIGDDLLATNLERIRLAEGKGACNAMIVKINQVGTVSEAIGAVKEGRKYGWEVIVSHRSGETTDDFIADFALGIGAHFIKSGAPARGERVAKYNRLLAIEKELKGQ